MKRFCNRCGRLIDADAVCVCRKNVKKDYKHIDFYDSKAWRKLSNYVKVRDYMQDRVQLYFSRYQPDGDIEQMIYGYVMDAYGQPRRFCNKLITHHIVPREDNYSLQYVADNLITLNFNVHEYVHMLYSQGKQKDVQEFLQKCVHAVLP